MAKVQKNGLLEEKELLFYTKSRICYTNDTSTKFLNFGKVYISKILSKTKVENPLGELCTADSIFSTRTVVGIGR